MLPDDTHDKMVAKWMQEPTVRAEVERLERDEMPMFDAILAVRKAAGLTQAQVAERMETKAPAVTRLENVLITGSPSPSLATLRKYAAALGKRFNITTPASWLRPGQPMNAVLPSAPAPSPTRMR